MKFISQFTKIMPFMMLLFVLQACSNDDDGSTPQPEELTIVETAQASANLSILVSALQAADGDLVSVLSGDGPFTVLAPTNAAFTQFLADNNFNSLDDVPTDVLAQVLLNHVIAGEVTSTDLTAAGSGYTSTSATGSNNNNLSLYIDTSSGVEFNGVSGVTQADIEASNGIIHIVDAVIGLPTVVTFATSNPNLSNLVASLQYADTDDSDPMLVETLAGTGNGPFTIFAPTNAAFEALLLELDETGETELTDLDPGLVASVITYHAIAGQNVTSSQLSTGSVMTIGGEIDVDATELTLTDPNGRIADIIVPLVDIQAVNGVVHAIDTVLLPPQ